LAIYLGNKGIKFQAGQVSSACSGFLDLSISNIKYVSNDPDLNKPSYSLTFSQNCYGRQAVGEISKSSLPNATQGFKITTIMDKQTLTYPISVAGDTIYQAAVEKYWCWGWEDCKAKAYDIVKANGGVNWDYKCYLTVCYVMYKTVKGYPGSVPNVPVVDWNIKITTTLDNGKSDTITVTKATRSAKGNYIFAYWAGDLVAGIYGLPDTTNILPFYDSAWKFIKKFDYKALENSFNDCWKNTPADYYDDNIKCADDYNKKLNDYLSATTAITIPNVATAVISGNLQSGSAVLDVSSNPYNYPVMNLKVDANWIGIYIPVTKPNIISVDTTPKPITSVGKILTTVRNDGDTGSIAVAVENCDTPVTILPSPTLTVSSGQTLTFEDVVYASATERKWVTCTAKAYDVNNPSQYSTTTVKFEIAPIPTCFQEGATRCTLDGMSVEVCQNGQWRFKESCPGGCKDGACIQVQCTKDTDCPPGQICVNNKCQLAGGGCAWWDIFCHLRNWFAGVGNWFSGLFSGFFGALYLFWLIISIIGAALAFGIAKPFLEETGLSSKMASIVSLIIAVSVFFLISQFWWLIILLVIGYIVIKSFMR
jgi:hypothetical protein